MGALAKAAHVNCDFANVWLKDKAKAESRATDQGHQDTETVVDSEPERNVS
ncbi:hypothetical protein KSB_57850 [Ktedonobacter robiniae]|uniref:Uncharacterized protein n=1 Tax=Ktedonobacter robiniae TaxID=2778365 RepID=A0ABQ3UYC6_9CHLR|nr:hypothetical protein KSB_57850 [Ktedonobacter robiniae]